MRLNLHNIGKFKDVSVKLDGMTVIAGENNTGKSTIGKALFVYLHSMDNIDAYIQNDITETLQRELNAPMGDYDLLCRKLTNASRRHKVAKAEEIRREYAKILADNSGEDLDRIVDELADAHASLYGLDAETISSLAPGEYSTWKGSLLEKINALLEINADSIATRKVTNDIATYFDSDVIRIGERQAYIEVIHNSGKKNLMELSRDSKGAKDVCTALHRQENISAAPAYIESPKTLDQLYNLARSLDEIRNVFSEILAPNMLGKTITAPEISPNNKTTATQQVQSAALLEDFNDSIGEIVGGSLQFNAVKGLQFQEKHKSRSVDIANLSNGIKALTLLEYALECGCLNKGDYLILDEPEINLHPDWQLKYAEQLVLLQKKLDITIIMTTHTPYFFEAIELFSKKYQIDDNCTYYLAQNEENDTLIDVTGDTEPIYKKLADPFRKLDKIRRELNQSE